MQGLGAKLTGGRWNKAGTPVVYAASHISLACLETLVHLNAGGLPLNRYLVEVQIPEAVWQAAECFGASDQVGWDAIPAGKVSIEFGQRWALARRSAILLVPSVIVPEEQNILINPLHPDAGQIRVHKLRKWTYHSLQRGFSPSFN